MKPLVVASYCACAIIWGTTYFAIRVSIAPGGYPTVISAALRFSIAALLLVGLVASGVARPLPRGRRALLALAISGALCFASYSLVYAAEERIPGGLAAVIFGTLPLVTAVLGFATGIERPGRAAIAGALISLAGLALISLERLVVSSAQAAGCLMVLGAVTCAATYNLILKRHATGSHPLATNASFLAVAAALFLALAAAGDARPPWPPPPAPTAAVLYLAVVGTVVAFGAYFYLLPRVKLMTLSTLVVVQPIIALVVDAMFEDERIAPRTYVGAAVTLAGVLVNLLGTGLTGRRPFAIIRSFRRSDPDGQE